MESQYKRIADLIFKKYGEKPDFPWREFPDYEVFRHRGNRKWFGLVMNIPPERLYAKDSSEKLRLPEKLTGKKEIHILDLKMPSSEIPALDKEEGIFPAYHMNAGYWISVLLEDILPDSSIMELVEKSYNITKNEK